jgi:hypothetical protein
MVTTYPGGAVNMMSMTVIDESVQWLDLDGTANTRVVVPGVLIRSDDVQDLSARDVRELVDEQGLEVVIDLRNEVEATLEGSGPLGAAPRVRTEHHSLYPPADIDDALDGETVRPWGEEHSEPALAGEHPIVRSYLGYLIRRPDSVLASIRAIANSDGSVLVHCAAGKDRTGTIVAIALDAAGVDRELIAQDYLLSGERIAEILARLRSSDTYRGALAGDDSARHMPVPGAIERVLELVDQRYGGTAHWLLDGGFSENELARLRERVRLAS